MKTIQTEMKSRFLQVCIGVSMVLLSAGFFVRSATSANAAPATKTLMPTAEGQTGKYILTFLKDGNETYTYMTDTETGKTYFLDSKAGKWTTGIPAIPSGL
jgi:hypothetical protein